MADQSANEVILRYLQDAIAAETAFESQLLTFSREGDDAEVQAAFAVHAQETATQRERLTARLEELGGRTSSGKSLLSHLLGLAPRAAQATHSPDERLVQNLLSAYSVEAGECAMYEALASVAHATGDWITEKLAKEIQAEEHRAADRVWSFIPSRSKIAFNGLTAWEIDPSVDTRMADDRITETDIN